MFDERKQSISQSQHETDYYIDVIMCTPFKFNVLKIALK